ncbi:TPA: DUF1024 family protein, partial [Staphylococcus aureus]|nr:DUF1024 family protein [Staphylococcus aureus]HDP6150876.1 DUF1024 family protein [Staphylococcus aureus]HEB2225964.1 DUF1024 family protein [Staphylococcus aureus]HEB2237206.1 DUF1024 family protein [Staphylococcus aureus]HEB2290392.1 DUF1024 family protein [Staphylococcus aureus]
MNNREQIEQSVISA